MSTITCLVATFGCTQLLRISGQRLSCWLLTRNPHDGRVDLQPHRPTQHQNSKRFGVLVCGSRHLGSAFGPIYKNLPDVMLALAVSLTTAKAVTTRTKKPAEAMDA